MKSSVKVMGLSMLLILVILSCKKQFNHEDINTANVEQVNQTGQDIENKILAFKASLENHLKSGTDYKIDSAVWYSEALVNYDYADVSNNLMGLDIDSAFFSVTLSDGKVTTSELSVVCGKIVDSLTIQFENLPTSGHLVFVDVFSRDSVAGSVTFGVIGAFGYGSPIYLGPFYEDSWWTFGWAQYNNGGYCDGYLQGTQTNDDAAGQIERRIRLNIGVPAQRHYATDIVTMEIWAEGTVIVYGDPNQYFDCYDILINEDDEIVEDNYYDYLCYVNFYLLPNFHSCLSPDEMNFYWDGEEDVSTDIIYNCEYVDDIIEGKQFMSISILGDIFYVMPNYRYEHVMTNTYGVWVVNTNEPNTFD